MSAGHSRGRAWAPLWQWAVWSPARFVAVAAVLVLAVVGVASLTSGGGADTPAAAGTTGMTPSGTTGPGATAPAQNPPPAVGAGEPSVAAEGRATSPGSGIALNWVRDWCSRGASEPWTIYADRVAQLTAPSYAATLLAEDGELFAELAAAAADEVTVACSVSTPTLAGAGADGGGVFLVEYETVSGTPEVGESTVLSQGVVVTVAQVAGDLLVVDAEQGA